ncbi:hypothetical protein BJ508DRAFT_313563 [Ascobolus immersus RN42]|uniref:Uncharacterized protein n=1 Tax=Ascobolus immersus RN42 TaxID=1160509 RepID=A0A3N4HVL2_ASCIM|nr:hypothetical protein BJ508DRAFT_313563 [Ascobolus immersus RN42]
MQMPNPATRRSTSRLSLRTRIQRIRDKRSALLTRLARVNEYGRIQHQLWTLPTDPPSGKPTPFEPAVFHFSEFEGKPVTEELVEDLELEVEYFQAGLQEERERLAEIERFIASMRKAEAEGREIVTVDEIAEEARMSEDFKRKLLIGMYKHKLEENGLL